MVLCRAIGLNILVSSFKLFRHPWGKGFEEKTKVAIQKRRPTALLRALVHLIPVGVALWEVTLNWNTYYVGSFLLKQVGYIYQNFFHTMSYCSPRSTIKPWLKYTRL